MVVQMNRQRCPCCQRLIAVREHGYLSVKFCVHKTRRQGRPRRGKFCEMSERVAVRDFTVKGRL